LLVVAGNASSLPGKRFVGQYDFGYAVRGDRAARIAQVFDDGGGKVYFEARPDQPMPAVFAGKELTLLVTQPEGQYFTARTGASEFTLVLGGARALVRRGEAALGEEVVLPHGDGAGRRLASAGDGLVPGVDYGVAGTSRLEHEQPVVFPRGTAALRAEVLDALSALVVRIGRGTAIRAVGRDDAGGAGPLATLRAQALRNALLARGVAARSIELVDGMQSIGASASASALRWTSIAPPGSSTPLASSGVAPVVDTALRAVPDAEQAGGNADWGHWSVRVQDITLARTLERWAAQAGYRVKWDAQRNFLIGAPDSVDGSFETALSKVLNSAGIRQSDYPLEACIYANTPPLVRITRQGEQARECEAQ
jgi:hypothetical protein